MDMQPQPEMSGSSAFGKYQLFASLGRGGMADVFLAVSRGPMGFNKLVVVKRLRAALAEEGSFLNMFLDEARLAARLNHPNVVHTYEVGENHGSYFIAMEYLEGQSLNKVIKEAIKRSVEAPLPLLARIISDALSGLHHAHELRDYDGTPLNIIHRDVSPHNVFVTYDGQVKLVDFGIAKAALSSTQTEVGVLKGKVAYMAPEQAMGGTIDRRADVFAMGIVLWELLTRKRLMTGDSAAATLHRLLNTAIPRVSSVVPEVDPQLDEIVAKALEKDPANRFQTALEMREAIETYIAHGGHTVKQEDVGKLIVGMFQSVREDVQRQIQTHMAAVGSATTTQELAALTFDSLRRFDHSASAPSGQLMKLGVGSGSGSGVISNPVGPPLSADATHTLASGEPARTSKKNVALFGVLAVLLMGGVAAVAFVAGGKSESDSRAAIAATGATPPATVTASPEGTPSAAPAAGQPNGQSAAVAVAAGAAASAPTASAVAPEATKPTAQAPANRWVPAPRGGRTPAVAPNPVPATVKSSAAVEAAPPKEEGQGFLTLDTYPWTRVSEGGRVLGTTPLIKVAMPAGTHTLTLENPEQGVKQTATVTIKVGETLSKRLAFK
jgi:serine/threonine-protein kinase